MTIQEAIEQLKCDQELILFDPLSGDLLTLEYVKSCNELNYLTYIASGVAIEVLKKQIPKELSYEGDGYDDNGELIYDTAFCPSCEKEFEVYYCEHCNYCPNCGQALEWGDFTD